jgi:serine protease Do
VTAALLSRLGEPAINALLAAELESVANTLRAVTVRISTPGSRFDGVGAGIVWPAHGRALVVTNAHVVPARRGDDLVIERAGGVAVAAHVLARDTERDLALVVPVASSNDWPAAAVIGDAVTLRAGEIVVALGHPLGVGGALSVGVVHAVPSADDELVRADIRLAPGNSGGPLATLDGVVVGVNCMIARGLGIAIPAGVADAFVHEVLSA